MSGTSRSGDAGPRTVPAILKPGPTRVWAIGGTDRVFPLCPFGG